MPNPTQDPRFLEAQQAIHAQESAQAARLLKALVRDFPKEPRVWRMLAQIAPNESVRQECLARAKALEPKPAPQPIQPLTPAPRPKPKTEPRKTPPPLPRTAAAPKPIRKPKPQKLPPPPPQPQPEPVVIRPKRGRLWLAVLVVAAMILATPILAQPLIDTISGVGFSPEPAAVAQELPPESPTATVTSTAEPTESPTTLPTSTPMPTATMTPAGLEPKEIVSLDVPRDRWTPTPSPTPTNTPTPTLVPTAVIEDYVLYWPDVGPDEQWIDVDLTEQVLTAYIGKEPVKQTAISSGLYPNLTVTGQFRIYYRLESQTMDGRRLGFDYVTPNVPHVQYFYGDFALHGAYWHSNFGQPMSHGCVNLSPADAEWLYEWAGYGTLVNVHY